MSSSRHLLHLCCGRFIFAAPASSLLRRLHPRGQRFRPRGVDYILSRRLHPQCVSYIIAAEVSTSLRLLQPPPRGWIIGKLQLHLRVRRFHPHPPATSSPGPPAGCVRHEAKSSIRRHLLVSAATSSRRRTNHRVSRVHPHVSYMFCSPNLVLR